MLREKWYSNESIVKVPNDVPVLFICGSDDKMINNSHSKDLLGLLRRTRALDPDYSEELTELVELPGGHNDTCTSSEYIETISKFIFKHIPEIEKL